MKMLVFKGIIIGLGKIIPGVSGALLAIALNVYDKGINAIGHFFTNIKENTLFLFKLGSGILLSLVLGSKLVNFSINNFYLPTMLLFIGLILGNFKSLKNTVGKINIKKILLFTLPLLIIMYVYARNGRQMLIYNECSFIILIGLGIIDAFTMIVPGISGTAVLMMLGYYNLIIASMSHIFSNIHIILPFTLGIVLGILLLVKVISYLIDRYREYFFSAVCGLAVSSVTIMFLNTFNKSYSLFTILIGLFLLIVGYRLSNSIENL